MTSSAERQARYRERHPERIKAARVAGKERDRSWRKANQARINAIARAKYVRKPKRPSFNESAWRAAWREKNRDWYLARSAKHTAARRALQKQATPAWANKFFIEEIYHLARLRTKYLGVEYHVDHIVPLQSKEVCGLHVEHNLQIIPAVQNISKSNTLRDNAAILGMVAIRGCEGG